ncbi:MAG: hypothetical protein ACRD6X_16840, partial [Pyrinomonadaceae bacterium]
MYPQKRTASYLLVFCFILTGFMFAIGQQPPASPRTFGERFVLRAIRTLHSAEATYASTYGNGIYGSLAELEKSQFIGPALATGNVYGYAFTVSITPYSTTSPPRFTVTATPNRYRRTGLRSFFIDDTGVIRGSDHAGGDANENDPEIGPCMVNDPSCYENFSIASLRTLHGAEFTFQATNGNGNFGTLLQLAKVYPLSPGLASGVYFGYAYT